MTDIVISWPRYQSGRRVPTRDLPRAFYRMLFSYMAEGCSLSLDSPTNGTDNLRQALIRALVTYPTEFRTAAAFGYRVKAGKLVREQGLAKPERDMVFRAYHSIAQDIEKGVEGVHVDFGVEGDIVLPERGQEKAMYPVK